ncbi:MAG: zinc ribbon domain-containing protein [Gemmatimonadales bacterium]
MIETILAVVVALAVLAIVLQPLVRPMQRHTQAVEPPAPEETERGVALMALREIEFDRETGKLSDEDYADLKARYTARALEALRAEEAEPDIDQLIDARARAIRAANDPDALRCRTCGPRPEPDAVFCSACGQRLVTRGSCGECGAAIPPAARFCEGCGRDVAA